MKTKKNKSCIKCGKELIGKQRKFCSPRCTTSYDYHNNLKNSPNYLESKKKYREVTQERKSFTNKQLYLRKREQLLAESRKYYEENREKAMQTKKEYTMNKYHSDEKFRMRVKLGSSLSHVIRYYIKTGRVMNPMKELCIDWNGIIKQLSPIPKNRKLYHVDHIIPLCKFDLTDWEQMHIAFAPENHRWLKVKENLIKGGRI